MRRISAERRRLTAALERLGLRVYPGKANFLLLYSDRNLTELLMRRGVMVRDCSGYVGLSRGYVRIAVRTPEENDRLLADLEKVMR